MGAVNEQFTARGIVADECFFIVSLQQLPSNLFCLAEPDFCLQFEGLTAVRPASQPAVQVHLVRALILECISAQ